ncbi:hypothetical protein ACWDBD_38730 [Streptomyces sp. NPDC001118]|uniref:hypothetical protein n=1 Tax=Streptomyces sp. NPDC001127 TaxID=3154377 RepID=UPI0033260B58
MNRTRRAIGAAALAVVALLGCSIHASEAKRKSVDASVVTPYNDGFSDAKRDDCEQGFKPACKWLSGNH